MKTCTKCKSSLPVSMFLKIRMKSRPNSYIKPYLDSWCKDCNRVNHYQWKVRNKVQWYSKLKQQSIALKCQRCDYDSTIIGLDFHHKDGKAGDKDLVKSSLMHRKPTPKRVKELASSIHDGTIIILCAICHRLEHTDVEYWTAISAVEQ